MLIMTFLITQGQSHVLKWSEHWNGIPRTRVRVPVEMHVFHISSIIISVNIIEAKLFFDLMGFEPWTSGSAVQYPNH